MAYAIPEQLPTLLKEFTKAAMKEQPDDLVDFAAAYALFHEPLSL